jgi:hypothetical protein
MECGLQAVGAVWYAPGQSRLTGGETGMTFADFNYGFRVGAVIARGYDQPIRPLIGTTSAPDLGVTQKRAHASISCRRF